MERRGFIYYDWNVSSGDGSNLTTTENILENVCTNVGSFDQPVVLMHDGVGKNATLKALPMLLETLAEEGYEFCSLDENLKPIQYKLLHSTTGFFSKRFAILSFSLLIQTSIATKFFFYFTLSAMKTLDLWAFYCELFLPFTTEKHKWRIPQPWSTRHLYL